MCAALTGNKDPCRLCLNVTRFLALWLCRLQLACQNRARSNDVWGSGVEKIREWIPSGGKMQAKQIEKKDLILVTNLPQQRASWS